MLYQELEVNVLIVGYRGYGHSEGTPSEAGLELDADAIFSFAQNHKEINN
jgi:abhydrolase domain-containing protein 13